MVLVGLDPVEMILQPWPYQRPAIELANALHATHYITPVARATGHLKQHVSQLCERLNGYETVWSADTIARLRLEVLKRLTYPSIRFGVAPDRVVQLAARQLGQPSYAPEVLARERARIQASLREANTRPATQASRAFERAVYGDHPYGYELTEATLDRISTSDLQALHERTVWPCRAKVSLVGAINRAQADALVTQLFAKRAASPSAAACQVQPSVPEVAPLKAPLEVRVPFEAAQAQVLIGQPGFKRDDPDYFALTVGNYILGGGGFVSRLTEEVREKRGLSYSVSSYFAPGLHAGAFTIGLQTRPDQAQQAIDVSRQVLRQFVDKGPTAAELKAAKAFLIGGFALRIDSNRKLLDNVSNIAWNGLPLSYLDSWTQQVERLTVRDIRAAFQRKLQPERMVTVVVGARE
jgi:zinc protease